SVRGCTPHTATPADHGFRALCGWGQPPPALVVKVIETPASTLIGPASPPPCRVARDQLITARASAPTPALSSTGLGVGHAVLATFLPHRRHARLLVIVAQLLCARSVRISGYRSS